MEETDRTGRVVRLLVEMEALRRFRRLYPPGHPALAPALERIRSAARAAAVDGTITLAVSPERLFLGGEEVALPAGSPARRLVQLLFHLGVATLSAGFPAAVDGLAVLAEALAGVREPPGDTDREAIFARALDLPGVDLVPIDLSRVQLVEAGNDDGGPLGERLWEELAARLTSDGVFALDGLTQDGSLSPGRVAAAIATAPRAENLYDALFRELTSLLRGSDGVRRIVSVADVRAFLRELVGLLDPDRRRLAIEAAFRHLERAGVAVTAGEDDDLFLDVVEAALLADLAVPETARRALREIAQAGDGEGNRSCGGRARDLLARIAEADSGAGAQIGPEAPPFTGDFRGQPWADELAMALDDPAIRSHLLRVLNEAMMLWPGLPVAERASMRLAEEFVTAFDTADFDTASRLAPVAAATRNPEAIRTACRGGVEAGLRALRSADRNQQATVVAILTGLGPGVIPHLLDALAEEESLAVRKRLLEAIARHGERSIPHLMPLLDDPRWYVVRNAIFLLRRVAPQELPAELTRRIVGARPQVLEEILKALVAVEHPNWLPIILAEIDGPDPERQIVAIRIAGQIPHPAVAQALSQRLRDRLGMRLREPAAIELVKTLGTLRDPGALPVLREVVNLKQWRYPFPVAPLRREAVAALAKLDSTEARRLLDELAGDRDAELAAVALRASRRAAAKGGPR